MAIEYTQAVVNCRTLHVRGLTRKLTKGTVVEGEELAHLIAKKAHFSEDPDSGAPLLWVKESSIKVRDGAEAKAEAEKLEAAAAEKAAEMKAESETLREEMKEVAEETAKSVEAAIKKPARRARAKK